jgi:hypothetical protein
MLRVCMYEFKRVLVSLCFVDPSFQFSKGLTHFPEIPYGYYDIRRHLSVILPLNFLQSVIIRWRTHDPCEVGATTAPHNKES